MVRIPFGLLFRNQKDVADSELAYKYIDRTNLLTLMKTLFVPSDSTSLDVFSILSFVLQ